jgi:hypothetical protein
LSSNCGGADQREYAGRIVIALWLRSWLRSPERGGGWFDRKITRASFHRRCAARQTKKAVELS